MAEDEEGWVVGRCVGVRERMEIRGAAWASRRRLAASSRSWIWVIDGLMSLLLLSLLLAPKMEVRRTLPTFVNSSERQPSSIRAWAGFVGSRAVVMATARSHRLRRTSGCGTRGVVVALLVSFCADCFPSTWVAGLRVSIALMEDLFWAARLQIR